MPDAEPGSVFVVTLYELQGRPLAAYERRRRLPRSGEVQRGEIWWASLGTPRGSEPGRRRPVVVVQSDDFNRSRIATVIVAAVTSNLSRALAPGNVACRPKATGLPRPSVINVSQLTCVSRDSLTERVSRLPEAVMRQVDDGLRSVLSL